MKRQPTQTHYVSGLALRENRPLMVVDAELLERRSVPAAKNKRTVILIRRGADGKWDAATLTDINGKPPSKPTRVRISEQTLARHYLPT